MPDDPGFDEVRLDLLKVAARTQIDRTLFTGAHQVSFDIRRHVVHQLVFELNAHVLVEDAGDEVVERIRAELPVRPRWLPRWLFRRIPTRQVAWTLTARPQWIYPQATLRVPGLGPAHMFVSTRIDRPEAHT
jgi:hypothetical protein